jgi:hypothetical protein
LDKRLLAYALAGAGAVTLAPTADAEIVYTPADVTITHGTLKIDLDNDGIADFGVRDGQVNSYYDRGGALDVQGGGNPAPGVIEVQNYWAYAASDGFPVGPDSPLPFADLRPRLKSRVMAWAFWSYNGHRFGGPWADVVDRFLGFRFNINGETHYGWARFTVHVRRSGFPTIKAQLTGYAYETEPDKTILAGDQGLSSDAKVGNHSVEDASIEAPPAQAFPSLGLLSLGFVGFEAWRQTR